MDTAIPNTSLQLIFFFLRHQKGRIICLTLLLLVLGCIPSVDSMLFKQIVDTVESIANADITSTFDILWPWIIIYTLWWEIINWLWRLYDYLYLKSLPLVKTNVIDEFYNYTQYHSHQFFSDKFVGYITSRISEASRSLEMVFSIFSEKLVMKISGVIASVITMYLVHQVFATILLIWLGVFCSISILCAKTSIKYSGAYAHNKATVAGKLVDAISNISAIRMFSAYRSEREYLGKQLDETIKSEQKLSWFMLKLRYVLGLSCTIMIFCMLYKLAELRRVEQITIGDFVLIITLCIFVAENIWNLTEELGDMFEELGVFNQSLSLIAPYIVTDKPNASELKITEATIKFQNVGFSYAEDSNLFTDKTLTIPGGQKVGLVGYSGSGKTTFVNLISRLYDLTRGKILIDGQNIKEVTQESLRDKISLIPQEPILFHRSIRDNIKYGTPNATDEEIYAAAKKAHIHDVIMKLPKGYNSLCGERGNSLSGGQRQRIIIARAILKNSPILILDEATSSLDNITEKQIQDSMKFLMQGRTVLVIAHRLSTLLDMDRILVFDEGRIIEDGTHEGLLRLKGLYYKLWKSQIKGFIAEF